MGIIRKRRYYFTDSSIASDTVIAFVMGGISFAILLAGIITSVATRGHVPEIFGVLYICAIILSVSGEIFAWLGNKAQEGSVKSKRISILLNIVSPLIIIGIIISGMV